MMTRFAVLLAGIASLSLAGCCCGSHWGCGANRCGSCACASPGGMTYGAPAGAYMAPMGEQSAMVAPQGTTAYAAPTYAAPMTAAAPLESLPTY